MNAPQQLRVHRPRALAVDLQAAKQKARLAFVAYERALIERDPELAEAARARFLEASAALAGARRTR